MFLDDRLSAAPEHLQSPLRSEQNPEITLFFDSTISRNIHNFTDSYFPWQRRTTHAHIHTRINSHTQIHTERSKNKPAADRRHTSKAATPKQTAGEAGGRTHSVNATTAHRLTLTEHPHRLAQETLTARTLQAGQVGVLRFGLQQVRQARVSVAEPTALTDRRTGRC